MKRIKSPRQLQHFVSIHDPITNLFHLPRTKCHQPTFKKLRALAMKTPREIAEVQGAQQFT